MKNAVLVLILLLAGGGIVWWLGQGPSREPVSPERVIAPRRGPIVRGVVAIGRVEPRTRIDLKSKANGIITRLHVDVAEPVREGDVIVELDREILEAGLSGAEGRLEQAKAQHRQALGNVLRIEVEKTDPELVYAERNWARVRQLFAEGIISEDEHDVASDRYEKAQYEIKLLDAQLEIARAQVVAAEGRLQEVRAQTELARQELAEAIIRSPIDGVVLHRYLEEGDSVSSIRSAGGNASIIMTLGDLSELYVDGEVDEVDVGKIISKQKIRADLEARVTVESFKDRTFQGRVTRIAPLGLEDRNGIVTFEVRIILENPEKLLLANMTASAQIVLEEKTDVLLISQGALITEGTSRFALLYDDASGRLQRQPVETGITDGRFVEILGGLEEGQKVLVP